MTQSTRNRGLIRMALMGTAFVILTIVLIVFQPGSPRQHASDPAVTEPTVTRVMPALDNIAAVEPVSPERIAQHTPAVAPVSAPQNAQPNSVRDLTFAAIRNLKTATTGETPAPGDPGSLLHSVVQRSIGAAPVPTVTTPEPVQAATRTTRQPTSGSYFVRPGDTLISIATEVYGDANMATELFESNKNIMSRPDSLQTGMVLALPTP